MVEAARAAARTKTTYLSVKYHRIAARRGSKRAAVAVAHYMLIIVYHLLRTKSECRDLGFNYQELKNRDAVIRRHKRRLEQLGLKATIEEAS